MKMHNKYALLLTLLIGCGLGVLIPITQPVQPGTAQAMIQKAERPLAPFELQSAYGQFDQHVLQGQWTIMMFGFTHCPDICPTALSRLAALETQLAALSIPRQPRYVFVSVDPQRDSVTELDIYVRHFSPSFIGVTGHPDQLKLLARSTGAQFQVNSAPDNYQVAHSTALLLLDPSATLRGRFDINQDLSELAAQLKRFIHRSH
ncbi:SCO family protein [Pseudoalteromonas sp. DL2-H2.2]|uniref:SCO family protein n=1 Tax=Pseudoalteromonas sp. DL2-H2.2 TaxID=2908889 RepID=UPI001F36AA88|nr:SCO family protein [Pseudoalteromonas sp. DL2-H2.2]MCF2907012.1 SCO family protein [Pseudoalteromonas sp. DL2-H2.2]